MTTLRRRAALAAAVTLGSLVALLGPAGATSSEPPAPAARADVRLTIDQSASGGRIISPRPTCERRRGVTVVRRTNGELSYGGEAVSGRDGRWSIRPERRGGVSTAFAIAPGDAACQVAQSGPQTIFTRGARPARRSITLQADGAGTRRGRVTSSRAACERGADVILFGRSGAGEPWVSAGSTSTDDQGRYNAGVMRPRLRGLGQSYQLTTVVVGTGRCAVAQSNIETVRG